MNNKVLHTAEEYVSAGAMLVLSYNGIPLVPLLIIFTILFFIVKR